MRQKSSEGQKVTDLFSDGECGQKISLSPFRKVNFAFLVLTVIGWVAWVAWAARRNIRGFAPLNDSPGIAGGGRLDLAVFPAGLGASGDWHPASLPRGHQADLPSDRNNRALAGQKPKIAGNREMRASDMEAVCH